jgi:hypothetical protein
MAKHSVALDYLLTAVTKYRRGEVSAAIRLFDRAATSPDVAATLVELDAVNNTRFQRTKERAFGEDLVPANDLTDPETEADMADFEDMDADGMDLDLAEADDLDMDGGDFDAELSAAQKRFASKASDGRKSVDMEDGDDTHTELPKEEKARQQRMRVALANARKLKNARKSRR